MPTPRRFSSVLVPCLFFVLAAVTPGIVGALPDGLAKSTTTNPRFTGAVTVSGNIAVVGTEWQDGFRGAAYVLHRDGDEWVVDQRLSPAGLGRHDHFGGSVALSGDTLVVGAPWHDLLRGAAYVFHRVDGVWTEAQVLSPPDSRPGAMFGRGVSLTAGTIDVQSAGDVPTVGIAIEGTPPSPRSADLVALVCRDTEAPPLVPTSQPDPVASVTVTNGTLEDRVEIVWPSVGKDAIVYEVTRGGELLSLVSSDETRYIDRTGTLATTYHYCVLVKDMIGAESDSVCANGSRVIYPPINVSASDGELVDGVEITWTDLSAINTGYAIYRDSASDPIGTTTAAQSSFRDTTAVAGQPYTYHVAATLVGGYESGRVDDPGWRGYILPPKNVSASDGRYIDRILVTWEPQTQSAYGYRIYRDGALRGTVPAAPDSFYDFTADPDSVYEYCVATLAMDVSGVPKPSLSPTSFRNDESIRVCDDGSVGLAAPANVSASDSTYDDRIRVTWKDRCDFEDGYQISRTAFGHTVVLGTTRANAASYDDFTAGPDTTFTYLVHAVTNTGGVSPDSSDTGYRAVVLAPTNVVATDGTYEDRVQVTWKSASTTAVLFKIFRGTSFIKSVGRSTLSYLDYGGTAGTSYDYSVVAVTARGAEAAGPADQGRRELLAPSGVAASDDAFEEKVAIRWTDNSRIEQGYVVSREDTHTAVIDTFYAGSNWTSHTDPTAVSGVTYNYSVRAYDQHGEARGYSAAAEDLGRRVLLAPTNVRADKGVSETAVRITWQDNSAAEDGYRIYRNAALLDSTADNFTSYVDRSPVLGTTGDYSVVAFDDFGASSAAVDSGYTTILSPVSLNASDSYEDRIELTWVDRSGIEQGFRIYRDGVWVASTSSNTTSFADPYRLPEDTEIVGGVDTPGNAWGVAVSGTYAYLADYSSGLQVIDISDPARTVVVRTVDTPSDASGVAVSDTYAYLADYSSGLQVIDISDPASAAIVHTLDTPGGAVDVAVSGNYAYVADYTAGLQVVDISNPESAFIVRTVDTPGNAYGVAVSGTYAYVTDYTAGLQVIDISDPESAAIVHTVETPGNAWGAAVSGNYAYVAAGDSGLQVIDIFDPESAAIVHTVDTSPGWAFGVAVSGNYAYVAAGDSGLQVIDIADPASAAIVHTLGTPGVAAGVAVSGNYAYVADQGSGLQVIAVPSIVPDAQYEYSVEAHNGSLTAESDPDFGSIHVPPPPEIEVTGLMLKLLASDGAAGDGFGASVAISGDRAIAGAYGDDDKGTSSGSAYIFERDAEGAWTQRAKLVASDGAAGDGFGVSVAISGDRAIAGAYGDDDKGSSSGSAYIFERDAGGAWTQQAKLVAIDGAAEDFLGYSVAINGDRAITGAYQDDDKGSVSGSACIFERDAGGAWTQQAKLVASDGAITNMLGWSVSVSGDRAIAGTFGANAAYIFERNSDGTWGVSGGTGTRYQTAKLVASDRAPNDMFGASVAISGDRAIAGARGDDDKGSNSGSAYIFERDAGGAWTQQAKLVAIDGAAEDFLGYSVAIDGDRAIAEASGDDDKGADSGSAYIFERDARGAWTQQAKLVASDGAAGDGFGVSVAISGDRAIAGASGDDDKGADAGSAYVADLAASAYNVTATDGTLESRVRITWEDRSTSERGFQVYRDGEPLGSQIAPNVQVYEDFDAEPGRTYQYGVATLKSDLSEELPEVLDYGWRPANGSVTGRISTRGGAAAQGLQVGIEPLPTKALLLDGSGGHVIVSDTHGTFGFTANDAFTIETWVKWAGSGGAGAGDGTMIAKTTPEGGVSRYPFSLGNLRSASEPGRLRFAMSDGTDTISVASSSTGFNDNMWHHVACVHDAGMDRLTLYVDGILQGQTMYSGLGNIANTEPVSLGAGPTVGSWFGGQLDEVEIWNAARSAAQISGDMDKQLVGNEAGLLAYWPLDEGRLDETSRGGGNTAITDVSAGGHYGEFVGGVYWTENSAPLDIYPVTDAEGNFILRRIRYGNLAEFKIRPFDGERQFEPAYQTVTLTREAPVENQVNFNDISSFTVSGVVRYGGSTCPAPDVQILVDDSPMGVTDKNGKFAVSVDYVGEDHPYTIAASLVGHDFDPGSYTLVVDHDTLLVDSTGVTFTDATTRTLSGLVGGGCGRSIGDVIITIQSEIGCLVETVTTSGPTYSVSLPPQAYLVTASVVRDSIPPGLNPADVVKFFQNLGERQVDLASADTTLDFIYRAPLVVTISGMESFVTCDRLTFEGRSLPADLPVMEQFTPLELAITVTEDYGAADPCSLESGTATIFDEISDREDQPLVLQVVNGVAGVIDTTSGRFVPHFRTMATTPSLIVGRMDEQGNDRTFQKYVRAVASVEGRSPVTATEWALVTGHVAPEGVDFVTVETEPMPFYILRDPPGDNSYAFLEKGFRASSTLDFDVHSVTVTDKAGENKVFNWRAGIDATLAFGFGQVGVRLAILGGSDYRATLVQTMDSTRTTVVSTQIDETFATSSNDLWTGGEGDIFIGAGLNLILAKVGVLEVEGCEVKRDESVGVEPAGFSTGFAYTEQHIASTLLPSLESIVEDYQERGMPDSVSYYTQHLDVWRHMLAANDTLKWNARLKENRSFSAGSDYAYAFASDTTEAFTATTSLFKDVEDHNDGSWGSLLGVYQWESMKVRIDRDYRVTGLTDTATTHSTTVGYVLSDDDIGDRFAVDVKQDTRYPSPVFDVRAGASSCPYEPWPDRSGRARMLKRDNPWIDVVPARRDDVAPGQAAAFTLHLMNQTETDEPRLYALRLVTTSNPGGAIVKVAGETIMNGMQEYFIAPGDAALQEASLTVERGPTRYDYERLAIILYAPCEYALWQQGAAMQAADTVYFDVTFQDEGPVVFGTPEPADGELSFGEDISITFNEEIDCLLALDPSMADSISLTYLDGPNAGSKIDLLKTCNGRTIILEPQADPNEIEGRHLQARVSAIQDRAGSAMPTAVTWEFEYRKSRFTWSELHLAREVDYLSPGVLTAELVNGTGETVNYTIAPPAEDWFTISPMSGSLPPGGVQTVTLDVRDDLALGAYDEAQVTASTPDVDPGMALLGVYLTVTCSEPGWAVNPSSFEHSMTMVAELDMDGALSTDRNDKVAAFVGSQLRGVAHIDSVGGLANPNVAFLTIYSNRALGEMVRFQLWDDTACKLYNATDKTYPFVSNGAIGSPNAPVMLTGATALGDSVLAIAVSEGWTWISTNVTSADMSVSGLLSDLTPTSGDVFKSHTAFSQYDETTGWSIGLVDVDNVSGYMIRLSAPEMIVHAGVPAPIATAIPVVQNWNWIGYLPQGPIDVTTALGNLVTRGLATPGDIIKGQGGFAQYTNSGWYGSLQVMEPGKGYKLNLAGAVSDSFHYPTYSGAPAMPADANLPVGSKTEVVPIGQAEGAPAWSVQPQAFEHNMTVTAVLNIGGEESADGNDLVGAFVNGECRGVARPVPVGDGGRYETFLMVYGSRASGESVTLAAFDAGTGLVYDVDQTLTFEADKVVGRVQEPLLLEADSVRDPGGAPRVFVLGRSYPNPFTLTTVIPYGVPPGGGQVSIRIYDVTGRLMRSLVDGLQDPGNKTVEWDARNDRGQRVRTGMYFIHMTAPGYEEGRRLIVLR